MFRVLLASIVQYTELKFRFRCTAAYTVLFSFVRRSRACCMQAVIIIASLMRRRRCGKLHDGLSHLLTGEARHPSIARYITTGNRRLCLPDLHSTPPLGVFSSEYCHVVWYGKKTRMA